jgi:hypothetical protein
LRAALSPAAAEARACFVKAQAAFDSAAAAAGSVILRSYSIGGLSVTLRFAGPALVERLSAALDHHPRGAQGTPTLTISIWDTVSTGVPMPPFPRDAFDGGTSGAARTSEPPAVRAKYRPDHRSLSLLDRGDDLAVFCVSDGAGLPSSETGAPFRLILHWWMADHGRQLVHAAALGTSSDGLLLVGKGGSGKSTTALACLGSRLRYLGDDYCLVSFDPSPRAHSLYSSAKLNADQARRFPRLASAIVNPEGLATEKALFLMHRHSPHHIQDSFAIAAIVVPRISSDSCSWLEPTSAGSALLALAPSTILQLPGAGCTAFATMSELVQRVPSYRLHLGADLAALPSLLGSALAGIGTA